MAKSLGIRVTAGFNNPAAVDQAVLSPVVPSGSLGLIVAGILAASAAPMLVSVNLADREVHARPFEGANNDDFGAASNQLALLTQVEEGRSSAMSIDGVVPATVTPNVNVPVAVRGLLVPEQVSVSVSSLISRIEDDLAKEGSALAAAVGDGKCFVQVDQGNAEVRIYQVIDDTHGVFDVGGGLADSVRYEQIPVAEVDPATLAFE